MKLFTRYVCDQTGEQFDAEHGCDTVVTIDDDNAPGALNVSRLLHALCVGPRHFKDKDAKAAYLSRFPWGELQDLVESMQPQPRDMAPDSGPPCERVVLTPDMKQALRPPQAEPPLEPMGFTPRPSTSEQSEVLAGKGPYRAGPDRPNQPHPADTE